MNWIFVILSLLVLCFLLWGYAIIAGLRKWWFTWMNQRNTAEIPTLVVGNITVGGTGKTPFILFLTSLFSENQIAVLSRGYGRRTKGFYEVFDFSDAVDVGDEPLEIKRSILEKGLEIPVYVGENRLNAVREISKNQLVPANLDFVILDDGLQHLPLIPDVSLVLTTHEKPFTEEYFALPFGKLREFKSSMRQYDFLVITKCPPKITESEISKWWDKNKEDLGFTRENVFFSAYEVSGPHWFNISNKKRTKDVQNPDSSAIQNKDSLDVDNQRSFNITKTNEPKEKDSSTTQKSLLITGVVNPAGISEYVNDLGFGVIKHFEYSDHFYFGEKELREWIEFSEKNGVFNWFTTRKDWQRMKCVIDKMNEIIPNTIALKIGVLHTEVKILEDRKTELKDRILDKIKSKSR